VAPNGSPARAARRRSPQQPPWAPRGATWSGRGCSSRRTPPGRTRCGPTARRSRASHPRTRPTSSRAFIPDVLAEVVLDAIVPDAT